METVQTLRAMRRGREGQAPAPLIETRGLAKTFGARGKTVESVRQAFVILGVLAVLALWWATSAVRKTTA